MVRLISDLPETAPYVFISYSSRDRERAVAVAEALDQSGISVWFDRRSIAAGSSWDAEIVRGVLGAGAVILLVSEASVSSPNVQQELRLAWEEQRPIVPLLLERAEYPDSVRYILAGKHRVELLEATVASCLGALLEGLGLAGVFPAKPPPSKLPPTLTSFIGRERELTEAGRLLGASRVLTLTGMGGTGKTRLALELAKRDLFRNAGGVFFVDLSAVMEPSGIASTK